MRNHLKIILIQILFFATAACNTDVAIAQGEPSRHDRIYHLQHRMLPKWTHNSGGKFYKDLLNGNFDILLTTASKIIGKEFSEKITIQRLNDSNGVLLIFPEPVEPPECYFIFIAKVKEEYRFVTYEKTYDFSGDGNKGVVGEWSSEGKHLNHGPHNYEDAEHFVNDLKGLK